ncbi:hypothetical protein NC653_032624 [Populus alba x Populus x berolinensis]|uniref:Uncharacterized protein n=1 Tax=Populus alba x Populus x berolinensis TaxID=444605 RepID=A0AAD6LRV6_9ROSI|nr:hypothetical protein NC653_032624 [Populus alba x Populus x berolinensis]
MITAQGRDNANENTGISTRGCRVRTSQEFAANYSRTIIFQLDLDGLIDPKRGGENGKTIMLFRLCFLQSTKIQVLVHLPLEG